MDDQIVYERDQGGGIDVIDIASDKIQSQSTSNPTAFINGASWGVWYADGERDLSVSTAEIPVLTDWKVSPTLAQHQISVQWQDEASAARVKYLSLTDVRGRVVWVESNINTPTHEIDVSKLNPGMYILQGKSDRGRYVQKVIIQ